jgi:hypothetical protein
MEETTEQKVIDTSAAGAESSTPSDLGASITRWASHLALIGQAVNNWFEAHKTEIQGATVAIDGFLKKAVELGNAAHKAFTDRLSVYPALANAIVPLAQRGWFISMFFGLSEIDSLAVYVASESASDLDARMASLYREDISDHTESIFKYFPERAFAIRPAVAPHLRGEYALSVPIFLAQADGICFSGAGKHIFHGQGDENFLSYANGELASDKYADNDTVFVGFFNLLWRIVLTSMSDKLPLQYSRRERAAADYTGLNRHTVLHGIALEEYATEENSLKAFSLLSCVASLLAPV